MLSRNPFARPFPERPFGRSVLIGHGRTGLFVFIALLFLFPVGLALAYGLLTFLVAVGYHFITERLGVHRTGRNWTLFRWTLDQAVLLLLVSLSCFLLYNATRDWAVMNLQVLLYITVPTVLVGLLPIVVSGIALQLRAEGENQRVAGQMQLASLSSPATPGAGEAIYARQLDHTLVEVHYRDGRKKSMEEEDVSGLVRCHPEFLVNPEFISSVSADAQGLRVRVPGAPQAIPVTPPYYRAI